MKAKLLLIANAIFLIISISFAFYWNKIYDGGPDEQKGDYIFYCLKVTIILTFCYLVLVKLLIRDLFPSLLLPVVPFINCFVSVILALVICLLIGDTVDTTVLQAYLFIHGLAAIGFVYLLQYFTKKMKGNV